MPGRLHRRRFVRGAGAALGGAALGLGWSRPGLVAAAAADSKTQLKTQPKTQPRTQPKTQPKAKIRAIESGARGVTLTLGLEHGPFPAPGAPYRDDTCLVFVPHHFRASPDARVDTLVHFHGHHATVREVVESMQIREQLADSRQNAILVAPQGPVDAADSRGGKLETEGGLEAMLGEVRRALQRPEAAEALGAAALPAGARIGAVALSAHSGGYRVAGACLHHGGFEVTEVYLFDALYGSRDRYLSWVLERRAETSARARHKLVCAYRKGRVATQSEALMGELDHEGVGYLRAKGEAAVVDRQAVRARAVFIATDVRHNHVMHEAGLLRRCLEWSCFRRRSA
ncbi:MAG: hypothetical protein KDK70_13190 [Myxococcales bacterium]|nr:hypothetical protein [Myxococcales bacterium]